MGFNYCAEGRVPKINHRFILCGVSVVGCSGFRAGLCPCLLGLLFFDFFGSYGSRQI